MATPSSAARSTMKMACVGLSASLTLCAPAPDDTLARIREQGFIRAGFTQEAPYALVDAAGRLGGESPVVAGLFSTPERRVLVRFSRPTLCARPALVRRSGAPAPSGLTAFAAPGAGRLAVVEGAVEHHAAEILKVLGLAPDEMPPGTQRGGGGG